MASAPAPTSVLQRVGPPSPDGTGPAPDRSAGRGRGAGRGRDRSGGRLWPWVAVVVAAAVLLRLPLLGSPLSRDEAGYLMVASQLGPGSSVYGGYWVDRPPLLLAVFAVADRLGGAEALRATGLLVVAAAVVAAAVLGATAAAAPGRVRAGVLCAATAGVFLVTPLFGTTEVNGELVAAPFVLSGVALLLRAVRAGATPGRPGLLAAAGVAGAAAVLVKQNQWDVVVALAALVLAGRWSHAPGRLRPRDAVPFLGGAAATGAAALAGAAATGTTPAELWDAAVVFRVEAAAVVASSASDATGDRLVDLGEAFLRSGAPLVLLLLVAPLRRRPAPGALDLRAAAAAVLAWESVAVLGGASYWPPYLICSVTGLTMATAVVQGGARGVGRAWAAGLVPIAWAVVACLLALAAAVAHPPARPQDDVVAWLRAHTAPGDDALVAYGHPDVLHGAGLHSPYPDLWSLPVRVHDPRLADLAALLSGPAAPDWVVLTGPSLRTWGIDARAGTRALEEHYVEEAVVGRYTVLHHAG
ncbi:hypothetical protein [Aquipuribacter hungaricus]|uniref:Glycosyltransferase RgtA/B/C/D-like domain-containing protein n=2 Tax=Aquipuribacter hungaricus TaxID=545624 RepID=A0ABV7WJI9_9MICO